jgi:PAS domain-containing protein
MGNSRVLIIETDDRTAHKLSESLCNLDNDTVHIERARSLVESVVSLARNRFDVVFTALELPDSTGLDTLCQIQQVTVTPIIVISDMPGADERERLLRNGACDVVDPCRSREGGLELMVKTAMDRHSVVEEKQKKISELIDANIDYARALEELKKVNQQLADEIVRRKEAEQKNTLLAAAIEHLDEALLITDMNDKIVYVNPAFERSSGYTPDEIIGADVRVLSDSIL